MASRALADTHYFYMGYYQTSSISGVEFDEETNTLSLVDNYTATTTSRWIAADEQFQNLYVAGDGVYQSYAVNTTEKTLTFTGANVSDASSCTLGVSLAVQRTSPGSVFGVAFDPGCSGVAISTDDSGALVEQIANLTYDSSAAVHGLAISPDSRFVYSADDDGSRVWVHEYDDGTTANYSSVAEVQELSGSGARHLTVHPNGNWVYVVFESDNEIGVYSRNATTGALVDTGTTYSLLPDGFTNTSSYWSSDVVVSNLSTTSPKYLFAFARGREADGYVNGFALDEETGAISEKVFIEEAGGSGGVTNSITPSLFSEEYFAVTDEGSNFVEVWQVADDASSASAVAHLDLEAGPVNVVWYS